MCNIKKKKEKMTTARPEKEKELIFTVVTLELLVFKIMHTYNYT